MMDLLPSIFESLSLWEREEQAKRELACKTAVRSPWHGA